MATERLAMRTIKRLFELRLHGGLSQRQTAKALGCGRTTVQDYERRARAQELTSFTQIQELKEEDLLERLGLKADGLFRPHPLRKDTSLPEWNHINVELSRKHVTLMLLWTEYREEHPDGYSYSQFCEHFKRWKTKLSVVMRQNHAAGEKVFVDYAGSTIDIVDPCSGEVRPAQIFIGVLGASSYTYCEATWTQTLPDWISSHRRMLEFYGSVPQISVPDNLLSGITKPDRYEAGVNRSYEDMARHYGMCVIPARSGKARDKAKAEAGVLLASRWIIAALRNRIFHSLEELNEAIAKLLVRLNDKKMRYIGKTRQELFETIDRPAMKALRSDPYVFAQWKLATVNIDYHIVYADHFYSTPYQLVKNKVEVRATGSTIEIFFKSKRVGSHRRSYKKGGFTTDPSHRPVSHQKHLEWTPSRIINWACSTGVCTGKFVKELIESKPHPEMGYRAALGVIRLKDKYGKDRLEMACQKAIVLRSIHYQTIKNMLKNGMEKVDIRHEKGGKNSKNPSVQMDFMTSNANVRGKEYYH